MNRLRTIRKQKNLTQEQTAKLLNVSRTIYNRYETGVIDVSTDALARLSRLFGVSADYLLGLADSPNPRRPARQIAILGQVPAGVPIEAIEEIVGYIDAPIGGAFEGLSLYALEVKGDSMAPLIMDGDVVVFTPDPNPKSGSVVVARINGSEVTLKRLKKHTDGITLIPNNPAYEPAFYTREQVKNLPIEFVGTVLEQRRRIGGV